MIDINSTKELYGSQGNLLTTEPCLYITFQFHLTIELHILVSFNNKSGMRWMMVLKTSFSVDWPVRFWCECTCLMLACKTTVFNSRLLDQPPFIIHSSHSKRLSCFSLRLCGLCTIEDLKDVFKCTTVWNIFPLLSEEHELPVT